MSAPRPRPPALDATPRPEPEDLSSPESSRRALRHALRLLAVAAIVVSIAAVVLSQLHTVRDFDWRFDPGWLVLALVVFFATPGLFAELWRLTLAAMGYRLPMARAWSIYSVSLLARYVPTQLLMPITRITMSGKDGVPRRVCLASIVYELALAAASSIAVGAVFVVQLHSLRHQPERWAVVAVPVIALIVLHPRVFGKLSGWALRRAGKEPLPVTLRFPQVLVFFTAYLVTFLIVGVGIAASVKAVHPLPTADAPIVLTAWAVGYAGALIAFFVPGGLGVRDGATASVVATVVPLTVAAAVAVAVRLVQTAAELAWAGAATLAARQAQPALVASQPQAGDDDHLAELRRN